METIFIFSKISNHQPVSKKLKMTHKFQKKLFCAKMGNPIKISHKNDPTKTLYEFSEKDTKTFFLLGGSQKSKKSLKNDQKIKKRTKNSSKTLFFIIMTPPNMDIRIWKPFLFFQKSKKFRRYPKKLKMTHKFQKKLFCAKMGNPIKISHKNDPPQNHT